MSTLTMGLSARLVAASALGLWQREVWKLHCRSMASAAARFLDTPEFRPIHDIGNNQTMFDRLDYQPNGKDVFHLNLFAARNWLQIPNDYDQLPRISGSAFSPGASRPGYQHTFGAPTLLTINPYIRKDQFNYYASRDPFADTPATQSQNRQLLNWGVKSRRFDHYTAATI